MIEQRQVRAALVVPDAEHAGEHVIERGTRRRRGPRSRDRSWAPFGGVRVKSRHPWSAMSASRSSMLSRRPQRIPSGGCTRASPTRRCDGGDSSACHSGRSPRRTGGRPRGRRRQLRHRRDPPPFVEGVDELVDRQIAGRHPEYLGHWRWFAARRVKFGVFASADSFHVIVESGPPSSAGGSTPQRRPHPWSVFRPRRASGRSRTRNRRGCRSPRLSARRR